MNTLEILQTIQANSQKQKENPELLKQYISDSVSGSSVITFYDWECPPRFLDVKDGKQFVNYEMDLEKVFSGTKLDNYTELPRVVEQSEREKAIIRFLNTLPIAYRFVKIIADTNAWYLNPESIEILGEEKVVAKFDEFANLIARKLAEYDAETSAIKFTELVGQLRPMYDFCFDLARSLLKDNQGFLAAQIVELQKQRTKEHLGMAENVQVDSFTQNTIASYAAEGVLFALLSLTPRFQNAIWINIAEADDRTISITNCLRKYFGLGPVPMIFPKYY